jgi:hypothetical protein
LGKKPHFGCVRLYSAQLADAQHIINDALSRCQQTGRSDAVIHPLGLMILGGAADSTIIEVFRPHMKIGWWNAPDQYLGMEDEAWVYGQGDFLSNEQAVARLLERHPDRWVRVELSKPKWLLTPGRSFLRMLRLLRDTMGILAREPLLVDTGRYQPKYQQRTYADMLGQIANELSAKLPNYHAKVKILSEEHVIRTHPAPQGLSGDLLEARLRRIKRQMRFLGYTRPAAEVEEEIRKRHERLRGSAASDDPPPTSF